LLIDGDMRRPRLHGIFDLDNENGLATLLDRSQPMDETGVASAIQETAIANLSVMTRGKLRSTVINLLYSPRLRRFCGLARGNSTHHHRYATDAAPSRRARDRASDGWRGVVVRSGKTLRDTVITARERFRQDGIPYWVRF